MYKCLIYILLNKAFQNPKWECIIKNCEKIAHESLSLGCFVQNLLLKENIQMKSTQIQLSKEVEDLRKESVLLKIVFFFYHVVVSLKII